MTRITRRRFVGGASASVFGLGMFACRTGTVVRSAPRSPNEEVRVAVVGLNGRGRNHVDALRRLPHVRVVGLCDPDEDVLGRERSKFVERGEDVATTRDLRRFLDLPDVDAISVASPNHWHALQAVWACQAGKDVYLEKPVSHNVWEGGQIVAAARRYGRIVQTGTQSRSSDAIQAAIRWLHAGNLGRIRLARGLCYKPRRSIGKVSAPTPPPDSVDYDLWTGPAPLVPLMRRRLHYDWHWVGATGNGDVGNQGIHQMDIARWALGEEELPPHVVSIGGRLGYDDDGDTPNTQMVVLGYGRAPLIFEVRGLPRDRATQGSDWGAGGMDDLNGVKIGVLVECEGGSLRIPNYSSAQALTHDGEEIQTWNGASDHFANFIDAVRSRRVEDLASDIREGHVSSALCHLGNVSHALGEPMSADELRRTTPGVAPGSSGTPGAADAAGETLERMLAHLGANEVDLAATPLIAGRALTLDPRRERFDDPEARWLATREYRAPYVVPERV